MSKRQLSHNEAPNKRASTSSKDSQIIKAVLLQTDGIKKQITMTINTVADILGGPWTYLGGWDENSTMMIVRDDDDNEDLPINTHKLQPPYHKMEIRGDIIVMKTDDDGNRIDFTTNEYDEFMKLEIEPWELEDGNDVENDEAEELYQEIVSNILTQLEDAFQREVSDTERSLVRELIEIVNDELRQINDDDDDDDPNIQKITEDVSKKALVWFEEIYERKPTDLENKIIETSVSNIIKSAVLEFDNGDDNVDIPLTEAIYDRLVDEFKSDNKRSPTDEESEGLKSQARELAIQEDESDEEGDGELIEVEDDDDDEEDEGDEEDED